MEERKQAGKVHKPWRLQPGHPPMGGRPKGSYSSLVKILKEKLFEVPRGELEPRAVKLIKKIMQQAEDGDQFSQKLIINYIDGLPKETKDISISFPTNLAMIFGYALTDQGTNPELEGEDTGEPGMVHGNDIRGYLMGQTETNSTVSQGEQRNGGQEL